MDVLHKPIETNFSSEKSSWIMVQLGKGKSFISSVTCYIFDFMCETERKVKIDKINITIQFNSIKSQRKLLKSLPLVL